MLQLLNAFHANVYKMTVPQESRVQVELGSFIAYSSQGCANLTTTLFQVQDQETIIWNVSGTYAFPDSVEKSVDLELDFGIDNADYNLEQSRADLLTTLKASSDLIPSDEAPIFSFPSSKLPAMSLTDIVYGLTTLRADSFSHS
ncbi:hypothetical protein Tco_0535856 [Tanacetum coccineum]